MTPLAAWTQSCRVGELYNLDTDIGEQDNIASKSEAVAKELATMLSKFIDAETGLRSLKQASLAE